MKTRIPVKLETATIFEAIIALNNATSNGVLKQETYDSFCDHNCRFDETICNVNLDSFMLRDSPEVVDFLRNHERIECM